MAETERAIISDIHANLEALTAVLDDIDRLGIREVYSLGDIVGYGPNPKECIDLSRRCRVSLLGNHDNGALFDPEGFSAGAERAIFWTRRQLEDPDDPSSRERWLYLAELPRTHREGSTLFVHGSPRSPLCEYVFPEDIYNQRKMERIFGCVQQYCFQGHTHVPGIFTESGRFFAPEEIDHHFELGDEKLIVNVGSVGQPRDSCPKSCYVLQRGNRLEFRRVVYDWERTRRRIHEIPDLDDFLGDRLSDGR